MSAKELTKNIYLYQLTNDYLTIQAINLGAIITDIHLKEQNNACPNMIASYDNTMNYIEHSYHYLNTMIGPIAGRIAYGGGDKIFSINQGLHHLHGGFNGISEQLFNVEKHKEPNKEILRFTLESEHHKDGYKGRFFYQIDYILEANTFSIISHCYPSVPQHVSLTSHLYFNLSGDLAYPISEHLLTLPAKKRLRIHLHGHPDAILPIQQGDAYDFRSPKTIGANLALDDSILKRLNGYDTPFLLEQGGVISLEDPTSKRRLEMRTNAPSVVVYTANHFNHKMILNQHKKGEPLDAIALETQHIPNAYQLNPHFAPTYSADNPYQQATHYTFSSPNFLMPER